MGTQSWDEIDAWLRDGGLVVASSDRASRSLQADFHRRRRIEGLSVWPTPNIVDWKTFTRSAWEDRNSDGRLLLNSAQELSLWCEIIHSEHHLPTALSASVRRLATMAVEASDLLSSFAPRFLRASSRIGWDRDSGEFSNWLAEFDELCVRNGLIPMSRVPLELIALLREDSAVRMPLRLAGFDRILPVQQQLFDAWGGQWQQFQPQGQPAQTRFYRTGDGQTELESCAYWCHTRLAANPNTRILVITQDASQRRGEIERSFLRFFQPVAPLPFEFSLGIPLSPLPLVRCALLLLRWLGDALNENELDWLFSSNLAASPEESSALQSCMRTLRRRDQQRLQWSLESFLNQGPISATHPAPWKRRMITTQRSLKESGALLNPVEWADRVPHLLETIGWPGTESRTSVEFQGLRRWQQALDTAGSLGFDGRRIPWQDFLSELEHAAADILFAPQSSDAPIQIAGPAESAGLTADAVWFLGADEESWPPVASLHPFLPPHVQRESAMPHSSPQLDWQFASAITNRLLASAPEVNFSFAAQKDDTETRPSRLVQLACAPQPLPANLIPPSREASVAVPFIDSTSVAFNRAHLGGGASVLSWQSQCPFKAFASARLDAKDWDAAEFGLSAKQRGQLLHDVLHSIWSGPPRGIRSHSDLIAQTDLALFVRTHVRNILKKKVPDAVRESMPTLYIDLEETRLVRLVTGWLEYESTRVSFTVAEAEAVRTVTIAGLNMNLRLDRVDRLVDDSSLVIDYKTGNVDPKSWDLPRPDDLQLPLYKVFGLVPMQRSLFDDFRGPASGGLVFAKIRAGDTCFAGRVADPKKTINPDLTGSSALVRRRLTGLDESKWKEYIDRLAQEFIHGRAAVDPRDYPKTCERCGLQSVCRIQNPENRARIEDDENTEEDDEE